LPQVLVPQQFDDRRGELVRVVDEHARHSVVHGLRRSARTPVGHGRYAVSRGLTDDETPTLFEAWQREHPGFVVRRVLVVLTDVATKLDGVLQTAFLDVGAQRVLPPA